MVTKPKANSVITTDLIAAGNGIIFRVAGAGEVVLDLNLVHADAKARAMVHGFIQRVSDAAALSRDEETGLPATPADKLAAMAALVEHYSSGTSEWSRKREGGGRPEGGLLLQCLMELYPEAGREKLVAKLKTWKPADKAAMLVSPKIKAVADRIRSEAAKHVDVEDLLEGL